MGAGFSVSQFDGNLNQLNRTRRSIKRNSFHERDIITVQMKSSSEDRSFFRPTTDHSCMSPINSMWSILMTLERFRGVAS